MAAPYPQNSSVSSAFCIDDLWDANRTWNSPKPQLSNCLQKCLNFIPLTYLVISLPLYLLFIHAHVKRYPVIRHTWLNGTQTLLCVVLSVIRFIELILLATFTYNRQIAVVDYVSPIALILTFALVSVYIQTARQHGVWTSGVLFVFWVVLLVLDIVSIASTSVGIGQQGYVEDVPGLVLHILHIVLVLVQLVLSAFVDTLPEEGKGSDDKNVLNRIPETRASFLSRITFWWFTSFVIKCHKEKLSTDDLWRLDQKLWCQNITHKFQGAWRNLKRRFNDKRSVPATQHEDPAAIKLTSVPSSPEPEVHIKTPSSGGRMIFVRALAHVGGAYFLKSILFKLIFDMLQFVQPVLLKYLIAFTADLTQPVWKGFFYALLMFVFALLQSLVLHEYFHRCMTTGMKFKSAIVSAVYQKALRLGSASRKESTVGEIVNLMSVDAQRFHDLMTYFNMVWSAPFQICISLYLLWQILGPSVLAGVGVMLFMMAVSAGLANFQKKLQVKQMKFKDNRMKLMNEILNGIKVLKLYAWEESFMKMVLGIRDQELRVMRHSALLNVSTSFLWRMGSYLVSLVSFAVYVMSDEKNVLDAEKAFVSLSLFNLLRFPLFALPMMISNLIQATVSVQRLARFLLLDELDPNNVTKHKSDNQICVENGSFTWGKGEACTLHDVNLHIKPGRLVAVVGSVGAGKSSLMSALLGEMFVQQGKVNVQGSMAYVAQQSWIQNATLRDNILFSANFDFERYCDVIDACALVSDLDVLPAGDKTEIGEKGINLSGGQKARVSLARAVYSDADVYLLDDPLSAVDAHVGKHIFDHVIGPTGLLKNKTRVLVTHGISILPKVDWVVVLCEGEVKEEGTLHDLLTHAGPCAEFIRNYLLDEEHHLEEEIELDEEGVVTTDDLINQVTTLYRDSNPDIAKSSSRENLNQRSKLGAPGASVEDLYKRSLRRCVSTSEDHKSSREILSQDRQLDETRSNPSLSQHSLHSRATSPARRLEVTSQTKPENGQMTSSVRQRLLGNEKDELVAKETTETGKVKYTVYMAYIRALRIPVALAVIVVFLIVHALGTGANFWLSMWSDDVMANNGTQSSRDRDYRLGVYGGFGVAQGLGEAVAVYLMAHAGLQACSRIHKKFLESILSSPLQFHELTPRGALVSRYSDDMDTVDLVMPFTIRSCINVLLELAVFLWVVATTIPGALVVLLPFGHIYYVIQVVLSDVINDVINNLPHGLQLTIATVSGGAMLQLGALQAARLLHKSLLTGVLRSSMSFFDTTPLGRIINRFSKDIDVLDSAVMMKMEHLITCFMSLIATLVVVSYSTPAFLVAVLPLLIVYFTVQQFYVTTSRQLKRLESTTRSPIYSHFSETLTGTSCIRAFGQTARFIHLNNERVDENNRCLYPSNLANRWLAMRLEFVGHIIVVTAAILAVTGRETLSPGTVGLSISYALNITQTLNWLVRMSCDIETDIVAVERIEEYSELQPEAPWHIPDHAPPESWPSEGRVDLDKYSVRYREGMDLVLKQVDVQIQKGEKIGVVGRTGAGKSSLTLGLLRVLEAAEGSILIDGLDISKMGLHDLRSKITIIPQDPVLFSGTLRMNLDPFNDRSDASLWSALELSHLKHHVSGLRDGLEHQVSEGGENMSVGQRQLICLARALLRKTRILILDEATAAVDLETDDLIQATIRTEFTECTVIIIAHRLNTIMDCDRILVLDTGRVKELATPTQLLADKSGLFYSLARAAGVVSSTD